MTQWRGLLLGLLFLAHGVAAGELVGRVVKITDGDTLTVPVAKKQIKARQTDIDAPENSVLYGIESEARIRHRGLWVDADPVPPWRWRRTKRR